MTKLFPSHKPKQIEFIQQRNARDCGVACAAMLTDRLYGEMETLFKMLGKSVKSIYPDDVFEVIDEIGFNYNEVKELPNKGRALVALEWKTEGLTGHYVVWDSKRGMFLDPTYGVVGKRDMLSCATIDYIWKITRRS